MKKEVHLKNHVHLGISCQASEHRTSHIVCHVLAGNTVIVVDWQHQRDPVMKVSNTRGHFSFNTRWHYKQWGPNSTNNV